MLLASVSFIPHIDHEEAQLVAVAETHLGTLLKNGQICREYVAGWSEGAYVAYVHLSHRTSADNRQLSRWGQKTLAEVKRQYGHEPVWEVFDDEVSARIPTWKSAKSYYLFSHGLTSSSPVFHGGRGTALSLPLLPISDELREDLFDWSENYRSHDRIFLAGGALEMSAFDQLANVNSELCRDGRDLTKQLEAAIEKPCYFYLLRHWAKSEDEDSRVCPSCGEPWRDKRVSAPSLEPFHQFHFRCKPCRLVSHCGVIVEDNENWKIGMYSKPPDSGD